MLQKVNSNNLLLFLKSRVQTVMKMAVMSLLATGKSDRKAEKAHSLLQEQPSRNPLRNKYAVPR